METDEIIVEEIMFEELEEGFYEWVAENKSYLSMKFVDKDENYDEFIEFCREEYNNCYRW